MKSVGKYHTHSYTIPSSALWFAHVHLLASLENHGPITANKSEIAVDEAKWIDFKKRGTRAHISGRSIFCVVMICNRFVHASIPHPQYAKNVVLNHFSYGIIFDRFLKNCVGDICLLSTRHILDLPCFQKPFSRPIVCECHHISENFPSCGWE